LGREYPVYGIHSGTVFLLFLYKYLLMKKTPDTKAGKKHVIPVPPKKNIERDPDDLVHEEKEEKPIDAGQEDPDDIIHGAHKTPAINEDSFEDPDDLVHDHPDDEE
jgi:hypothetical protein